MRPLRIEVEGFSAYRQKVEVDFDGVDFFSITGPTGSGKSSLVDAMIFALYGRVPRLGGNAVAPVITAGTDRARVRFFFEVDDVVYDATRMAQRTPSGGANVKEARLQKGEEVIADGPGDVSTEVEHILRLGFEDFTRTVVLPQGDFARFLEATKSERQGLLRNLLGLDVYTRMRELARTRAAVATQRVEGSRRSLDDLTLADDEARADAAERLGLLEALNDDLPALEDDLAQSIKAKDDADADKTKLETSLARLTSIEPPPRLDELETLAAQARSDVVDGEQALKVWDEKIESLTSTLADLASAEQIDSWMKTRARLEDIDLKLDGLDLVAAGNRRDDAERALTEASDTLEKARLATSEARAEHAAHVIAGTLVAGEPCPVCTRHVEELPELAELAAIEDVEAKERNADSAVKERRQASEDARAVVVALEKEVEGYTAQRETLIADLQTAPDDLEALQHRQLEATAELAKVAKERDRAELSYEAARKRLEEVADDSRRIGRSLTEAQLSVADLDPPVPEADEVTVQWKELLSWRDGAVQAVQKDLVTAAEKSEEAASQLIAAKETVTKRLVAAGVPTAEPFAVQVATSLQDARSAIEAQSQAAAKAEALEAEITEASEQAGLANAMANHLKANGFEQWLMSGALAELVGGANDLIGQLSDGGYSLHSDESGSFSIVDHRNADEMRRVETLSGGETFLVSLALALSLAETLSAKGGAGLDAIILDEGFGTLDDESLDTVASVLEELAGKGLMVGVITHVKELAARAPTRFEVSRDPRGAQVRQAS